MKTFTHFLIYIAFLVASTNNYSQKKNAYDLWLESYNTGIEKYSASDWTNAIPHFENALQYIPNIDFSTNAETQLYPIENHYYLGLCHVNIGQATKGIPYLEWALENVNALEQKDEDYITGLMTDLGVAYSNTDLNKALYYREAVVERFKVKNVKDFLYATNLFNLAFTHKALNQTEKFYELLEETEKVLVSINGTNNDYYAYTVAYLGIKYHKEMRYSFSNKYLKKAIELKQFISESAEISFITINLYYGQSLYSLGKIDEAIPYLESVINHDVFKNPKLIESYIIVANDLLIAYQKNNNKQQALATLNNLLDKTIEATEKKGKVYDKALFFAGTYYITNGEINKGFPYLNEALNNLKLRAETTSPFYASVVTQLAFINEYKGEFDLSERQYNEALTIYKTIDSTSVEYGKTQSYLGNFYSNRGDYKNAEIAFEQAITIYKDYFDLKHPGLQNILINYTNLLINIEAYDSAEIVLNQLKANIEETDVRSSLLQNTLGRYYYKKNNLKEALFAYEKSLDLHLKFNEIQNYSYAIAMAGLGSTYKGYGDYDKALEFQIKGLNTFEKALGKNNIEYGKLAQELAATYLTINDYDNSLKYYEEAKASFENTVGKSHFLYGLLATNLADLNFRLKNYNLAEELCNYGSEILKNIYGKQSLLYAESLLLKPVLDYRKKDYIAAIKNTEKIRTLLYQFVDDDNETYMQLEFLKGVNHEALDEHQKAFNAYNNYINKSFTKLEDVFSFRSEAEKKSYLAKNNVLLDWYRALLVKENYSDNTELITNSLNKLLILKNLLLNSSKDVLSELKGLNDPSIDKKIASYNSLKKELAKLNSQNAVNQKTLKEQSNKLEKELITIFYNKVKSNTNFDKDWKNIQSSLKPGEIAIEFSEFENRDQDNTSLDVVYIAYIIDKNLKFPKVVKLFEEKDLIDALKNQTPNSLYKTRGSVGSSTKNTEGLYDIIWKPLEKHLVDVNTIYFSPTGLLNQIPFAALNQKDSPILASQYNLVQMSNTYNLVSAVTEPEIDDILFVGGVVYDYENNKMPTLNSTQTLPLPQQAKSTRGMGEKWGYLPGTLSEIQNIESLFSENNKAFKTLSGKTATETQLKKLSGTSPNILHIATHGFFFENPKNSNTETDILSTTQTVYKVSEDPLMRSGLLFAGANYAWQNGENPYEEDDGVLTALEIANLDLSQTSIVVLSACETGLGDIDGNEGVYGLQRAFKMAGVDIIIMSLWEVPDAETSEFMQLFYRFWLSGKTVHQAFRDTQLQMANKYQDNPEKWAAFVLVE